MKMANPVIKIKEIKHSNKITTVLVWSIQSVKKLTVSVVFCG